MSDSYQKQTRQNSVGKVHPAITAVPHGAPLEPELAFHRIEIDRLPVSRLILLPLEADLYHMVVVCALPHEVTVRIAILYERHRRPR